MKQPSTTTDGNCTNSELSYCSEQTKFGFTASRRLNGSDRWEHESQIYWKLDVPESQLSYEAIASFAHVMWDLHISECMFLLVFIIPLLHILHRHKGVCRWSWMYILALNIKFKSVDLEAIVKLDKLVRLHMGMNDKNIFLKVTLGRFVNIKRNLAKFTLFIKKVLNSNQQPPGDMHWLHIYNYNDWIWRPSPDSPKRHITYTDEAIISSSSSSRKGAGFY